MKTRESKSKADSKKSTKAKTHNFANVGSIQAKAESTSSSYASGTLPRSGSMINNVSKTLQKKSKQAQVQRIPLPYSAIYDALGRQDERRANMTPEEWAAQQKESAESFDRRWEEVLAKMTPEERAAYEESQERLRNTPPAGYLTGPSPSDRFLGKYAGFPPLTLFSFGHWLSKGG